MTHVQPTRVHIKDLPQVVLGTNNLSFKIGHRVKSVPRLSLEDDNIIYDSIERPNLRISNSRAVFFSQLVSICTNPPGSRMISSFSIP